MAFFSWSDQSQVKLDDLIIEELDQALQSLSGNDIADIKTFIGRIASKVENPEKDLPYIFFRTTYHFLLAIEFDDQGNFSRQSNEEAANILGWAIAETEFRSIYNSEWEKANKALKLLEKHINKPKDFQSAANPKLGKLQWTGTLAEFIRFRDFLLRNKGTGPLVKATKADFNRAFSDRNGRPIPPDTSPNENRMRDFTIKDLEIKDFLKGIESNGQD